MDEPTASGPLRKFEVQVALDQHNKTAKILCPPEMILDVDGTTEALRFFSVLRMHLQPPVADAPNLIDPMQAIADPRFWIAPDPMNGGVAFTIRHPGFGWLAFQIPEPAARQMRDLLAEKCQPAAAKPTTSN